MFAAFAGINAFLERFASSAIKGIGRAAVAGGKSVAIGTRNTAVHMYESRSDILASMLASPGNVRDRVGAIGRVGKGLGRAATWSPLSPGGHVSLFEPIATAGRPLQLNFALQRRLVGGTLAAGAVAGLYSASSKSAPAAMSKNGNLEIVQPMDATGDLALSMYKRGRGG